MPGLAERAELVARLTLQDNFSRPLAGAERKLTGFGSKMGGVGSKISAGFGSAVANVAKISLVAGGFLATAVKTGIDDLSKLETATTSVDGAIKQMGLTGQLTAAQVAQWGAEIETSVHSAFDDKDITQAATTLLRFGRVTPQNLRPALVVMTDLAAKTGSVDSASSLLAKALADPTKAAGRLARQGIILTKAQQDQIDAFVKAGKVGQAQALVLDAVATATKGAADASQGPYKRAINELRDASENARKALAIGFLPIIERVADFLSTELAKPETIKKIEGLGKDLASGFDSLLSVGTRLPWKQIGDSFALAGKGAKAVLDAFVGLPPWVQTAVLTGWGLNKLTGGAAVSIGVDLIKGAGGSLFAKGGSPANPLWVAPVGGGLGGAGGGIPAAGGAAGLGLGGTLVSGAAITFGLAAIADTLSKIPDDIAAANTAADAFRSGDTAGGLKGTNNFFDTVGNNVGFGAFKPVTDAIKSAIADNPTVKAQLAAEEASNRILATISYQDQRDGEIGRTTRAINAQSLDALEAIRAKRWNPTLKTVVNNRIVVPIYVKATRTYRLTATSMASSGYSAVGHEIL